MTSGPAVPANVADAVCQRWPDRGPAWLHAVGPELQELCSRHEVEPGQVLPARYGFVVTAHGRGVKLVMRASPDSDADKQAKVAVRFGDLDIGPRIHEVLTNTTGTWTIMDRVEPGCSFSDVPPSGKVLDSLARTLGLLSRGPTPPGLPSLFDWLRNRLVDDDLQDLPPGRSPAPPTERAHALKILAELAASSAAALCHGDLSPGNILYQADGRFLLVDPRGLTGELTYDLAVLSQKAPQYGQTSAVAERLADALHADRERVRTWLSITEAARV